MRNSGSLKQEFLRKWITGLQNCSSLYKNMGLWERKKAIKLSADLAMASTRNQGTCWSRALLLNASSDDENKVLTEQILGLTQCQRLRKLAFTDPSLFCNNRRIIRSRKILKRSRTGTVRRVKKSLAQKVMAADSIAKRLVQKKARILKSLLPGGEFMDEVTLIEETLDYIESLRAQVEVMQSLASASELINHP